MALNIKTFFTRLGSAVVFSALMMLAFLWTEWAFVAMFFVVNILCLREYANIVERILHVRFARNEKMNFYLTGVASFLLICSLNLLPCTNATASLLHQLMYYFVGLLAGALITFLIFKRSHFTWYLLTGVGYISLSLGLFVQFRYQSLLLPLILLLSIWMNDTMAYLCGSFFGKTKLIPSISPNKTIEGSAGGVLFTMAFVCMWGYYTPWFPLWQWIMLGLIAAIVGSVGDLAESKLKRMAEIKDSGTLMPGHGGALDRFDSLLLAAPMAFLFALIFMKCFPYAVF